MLFELGQLGSQFDVIRRKYLKDIVLVPFPFTDLSSKKKRQELVISNKQINKCTQDFILLPITSKISSVAASKDSIQIDSSSLSTGSLPKLSAILTHKIYTSEQSLILKVFAKVKNSITYFR